MGSCVACWSSGTNHYMWLTDKRLYMCLCLTQLLVLSGLVGFVLEETEYFFLRKNVVFLEKNSLSWLLLLLEPGIRILSFIAQSFLN